MHQLSIETYVGGEVRVICVPSRQPSRTPTPVNSSPGSPVPASSQESSVPLLVNRPDSETASREGVSGFGLLPVPTSFGLPARRAVSRLARTLDSLAASPGDVIFFTGTLPGSTPSALLGLSQWSGYVVHRLKAWATKLVSGLRLIYVWEWQKRGALHLHLAAWCPSPVGRERLYAGMRDEWIRLLVSLKDKHGVDLFRRAGGRGTWLDNLSKVRARAEWVRKSVGAYLGKYLGKAVAPGREVRRFFFPSRWWGSTVNLKRAEKKLRWRSEYYYSTHGAAFSAMDDVVSCVSGTVEWSSSYKTKVVRGQVYVAMGARTEFVKAVVRMVNGMEKQTQIQSLDELIASFFLTLNAIRNLKPKWFRGFSNSYENLVDVFAFMDGGRAPVADKERLLVLIFAAASALEQSARFNQSWGSQWLSDRMIASAIASASALQKGLLAFWDEKYLPLIDEESFVRSRHDIL
jgi:hypothetical protein